MFAFCFVVAAFFVAAGVLFAARRGADIEFVEQTLNSLREM